MDPVTQTALIAEFSKHGILGGVIIALAGAAWVFWTWGKAQSAQRIEDHAKFGDRLVGLVEKGVDVQKDTNVVLEIIKEKVSK